MKTYYWTVKPNFGDLLTPLLIKRFTGLTTRLVLPHESEVVMVGSLLHHLPSDYKGVIAGSGALHERTPHFPSAKVLGLRGHKTYQLLGQRGNVAIGDPGLLADELIRPQERIYNLGLVPHWSDSTLTQNPLFMQYNPLVINVADDPIKVITQIAQCKKIVASSLHAIILADALFIPRRIELAPSMTSNPYEGGTFKWEDYNESIGMKFVTGVTQEPSRNAITERQHELFDLFKEIKRLFN